MDSRNAIQVDNVSKRFLLRHEGANSLKSLFLGSRRRRLQELWALRDVDFAIPHGQTVAVIGHNGSGKSTLLGLLARVYVPDGGSVSVDGRIAPLLELGAGFHEDLTGYENIALHGSILGLSTQRVAEQTPAIVEFSELDSFIDTPIRSWSAGMVMRLGFSIAVHSDPSVLLIDEVLAVGDEAFQHKCFARIEEFQRQGKTILFVSHDLPTVERVASRTLWLKGGRLAMDGPTSEVLAAYHQAASSGGL